MSRIVDIEPLIKEYESCEEKSCYKCALYKTNSCEDMVDILKGLPTIEPQRMRGKWIAYDGNVYMCSCCGRRIITNPDYIKEQKFCFRCGADMRGTE